MNLTTRLRRVALAVATAVTGVLAITAGDAKAAPDYVPGKVLVGYSYVKAPPRRLAADVTSAAGTEQLVRVAPGQTVWQAIASLRRQPGVGYAVPDYIAHAAGSYIPDDPGRTHSAGGWQRLQWNFLTTAGVNAPRAWANLIADGRPGGRGVVVAILDTGVAFRNWRQFRKSPDFAGTRFTHACDLVLGSIRNGRCTDRYALDRDGHGTFVAGTIAEATDNGLAATGLAYGTTIMPVRVLDASGSGDAATIARAIRYATNHGAKVINLSLEFDLTVTSRDIPGVISAINFAHRRGVVVVAAAGNDSAAGRIAYPAAARPVISVGATTRDRCLAEYSNAGPGLDLVAPGGEDDSSSLSDPHCHPQRNLPDIYQMTLLDPSFPGRFGLPGGWFGTSMASAHVAAAAALVIASRVIGRHPAPDQVRRRLEQTAKRLGSQQPDRNYGYGLLDAGAATAP